MRFASLALPLATALACRSETALVPTGAVWKYYASGPVSTNWQGATFDDGAWFAGAQFGYGEDDEQTTIPPVAQSATVYFRRAFVVTNVSELSSITLRVLSDDGCVIYANGVE